MERDQRQGSTIAFEKMLEKVGLRVGVFSSPISFIIQTELASTIHPEARLETLMADYDDPTAREKSAVYKERPSLVYHGSQLMITLLQRQ